MKDEEVINNGEESAEEPNLRGRALSVFDPYKKYIYDIKRIPVLTKEEERRLTLLYLKNGDEEAAYKLIISNLRLVVKIAMEYHRTWVKNISDLVQEGNIGLMQALKKYDPYKNVKFSSYASFWIRAYIIKFIMDNFSLIKIGKTQAQRKLFFNLSKEKKRLERLGYDVGPKLLAQNLSVKEKEVREMEQRMEQSILSLDEPIRDDSGEKHLDTMSYDEEPLDDRLARDQMRQILRGNLEQFKKHLNLKELYIFENRVYAETPKNLREIGEALKFSRELARQVEANVLRKLKAFLVEYMPEMGDL